MLAYYTDTDTDDLLPIKCRERHSTFKQQKVPRDDAFGTTHANNVMLIYYYMFHLVPKVAILGNICSIYAYHILTHVACTYKHSHMQTQPFTYTCTIPMHK